MSDTLPIRPAARFAGGSPAATAAAASGPGTSGARISPGFGDFVRQHSAEVVHLARLLLPAGVLAEPAAVQAFRALHTEGPGGADAERLRRAAYGACIRVCRRMQPAAASAVPDAAFETRVILALRYGLRLPPADIARITGSALPQVKAQLRQAREAQLGWTARADSPAEEH